MELAKKRFKWVMAIKVLLIINIVWQTAVIVANILAIESGKSFEALSNDGFFLMMRLSGDSATIFFLLVGIVIRAMIQQLPRETQYEKEIAEKQQKAIDRLWLVVKWFMILSGILIVSDFV